MEPALETKQSNVTYQVLERRCTQCGEKLATHHDSARVLPNARTRLELCSDCGVHDLPHTD